MTLYLIFFIQFYYYFHPSSALDFINGWDNTLQLAGVEGCTFKIKLEEWSYAYLDIYDGLIHSNFHNHRVFYLQNYLSNAVVQLSPHLDFRFFEKCAIHLVALHDNSNGAARLRYIWRHRDTHRGDYFSVWIAITTAPIQVYSFHEYDYRTSYRLFFVFLRDSWTSYLFYFCTLCKNQLIPVYDTARILQTTPLLYRHDWEDFYYMTESHLTPVYGCRHGFHLHCRSVDYICDSLGADINVTIYQTDNPTTASTHSYGFFEHNTIAVYYEYSDLRKIYVFKTAGQSLVYCNYEIKAERISFSAWLAPFNPWVWTATLATVLLTTLLLITVSA